jgi:hypothetical protein
MLNYNTGILIEAEALALVIPRKGSGVVTVAVTGAEAFVFGECHAAETPFY